MKEKFNAAVFSDIVNMIKVKMRIMVLLVALDQLIPIFQDHSSIKEPHFFFFFNQLYASLNIYPIQFILCMICNYIDCIRRIMLLLTFDMLKGDN